MTLIVLDLETTGTTPGDDILEIGAIVLDKDDSPVGRFSRLCPRHKPFHEIDPFVRDMHTRNGLWEAVDMFQQTSSVYQADWLLADFLAGHGVKEGRGILVGFSIDFDRRFIRQWMPQTERLLSHRMRDIGAMLTVLGEWGLPVPAKEDLPHRALLDCEVELSKYVQLKECMKALHRASEGMAIP
jgi:oligoribonuclease